MRLSYQNRFCYYGLFSLCGIITILGLLLFPVLDTNVDAIDGEKFLVNAPGDSLVAIGFEGSVLEVDLTPTDDGLLQQRKVGLRVKTKNAESYEFYIQALNGEERLVSSDKTNTATINPVPNNVIVNRVPVNTWGVEIDQRTTGDLIVRKPTANPQKVRTVSVASEEQTDRWTLSLTTKIDTSLPAGTYRGGVIVSVLAKFKVVEPATMEDITYMQDITPELCANSELEKAYVLVDQRDNQSYTVKKMKDDNCWMTENLALMAPSGGRVLTSADSDVASDWMLPETKTSTMGWSDDARTVASANLNNDYGTYFTWCGATAGTCSSVTADEVAVTGSVCPKGWRLPLAGSKYDGISGSFYYWIDKYTRWGADGSIFLPVSTKTDILNLQYGGIIGSAGSLSFAGSAAFFWSSVASENFSDIFPSAYRLIIDRGYDFETSASASASAGQSVRCLAR